VSNKNAVPARLLVVIAIFFAVIFTASSIRIHGIFGTSAYDLGLFDQAFWRYSQLLPNFNTIRGVNILGDHFSLIALIFAPLYKICPDISWAFVLQSLSVAIGGVVLFQIARYLIPDKPWLCLAFSLAYYLHPAVHNTLLWQYHEIVLASGLYMVLIWSYLKDRQYLFIIMLLLLLSCREDMPFTLVAFGIVALIEKRWRYCLWAVCLSVVWWLVVTRIAMPYFNGVGYFRAASGPLAVILGNIANPAFYLEKINNPQAVDYLWKLFLPAGLLGLLAPRYLLPALPTLAANVLIGGYNTILNYHYSVSIMPFFFWAALVGAGRMIRRGERSHPGGISASQLIAAIIVAVSLVLAARYSVLNLAALPRHYAEWQDKAARRSYLKELDAKFGAKGVAASDWLVPHLAHRESIYLFPNPWKVHYWGVNGERPHHPGVIRYIVLDRDAVRVNQALYDYLVDTGIFAKTSDKYGIITLERVRQEAADREKAISDFRNYTPIAPPALTHLWLSPLYQTAEQEFRRLDIDPSRVQPPAGSTFLSDKPSGTILDLELGEVGKSDFTSRYVHAEIVSPAVCTAKLSLGSDDGITVWYNGKQVLENIVPRPAVLGDDEVDLKLNRGSNNVLFRVNNVSGAFRLQAALKVLACDIK
jgi:uncharacterized membrane protein